MQIFLNPLAYIGYLSVVAMHFASPALPCRAEKILKYVNLALHVLLYFVMMLCRIPLEEVVLLYLLSLLLYLLSALLFHKMKREEESGEKSVAEKEGDV